MGLTMLLVWGGVRWCRVTPSLVGRWDGWGGTNNFTCWGWGGASNVTCLGWGRANNLNRGEKRTNWE